MKFSVVIFALVLGAASAVIADVNYFDYPPRGSVFSTSDSIRFEADDVSNDSDDTLKAILYRADGKWIEDIGTWTGTEISGDDDFSFTWDVDVGAGNYFVRIFELGDDNDDINRSYTFSIGGGSSYQSQEAKTQSNDDKKKISSAAMRRKRSIYAGSL